MCSFTLPNSSFQCISMLMQADILCWAPRPTQPAGRVFFSKNNEVLRSQVRSLAPFCRASWMNCCEMRWLRWKWKWQIHWPHLEAFWQKKSISWDFKKVDWRCFAKYEESCGMFAYILECRGISQISWWLTLCWATLTCQMIPVAGSVPGSGMLSATFPSFAFLPSTASIVAMGSTTSACRWFGSVTRQLLPKNEDTIHLKLITDYKDHYGLKASWWQSSKITPMFIEPEKHNHFMED